jgi:preprotein translocase subunit SecF
VVDINRQLLTQKSKYEDDILVYQLEATNLKATIEEKEHIICELRSKMLFFEHRNALLQRSNSYGPGEEREAEDGEGVDVVVVQHSNSYDLREKIQLKDTKLHETEKKLHQCERQLSKEQNRQSKTEEKLHQCEQQLSKEQNRQCMYMVLIGLLVVVVAIVVYLQVYMYHRDDVQCFCEGLPICDTIKCTLVC